MSKLTVCEAIARQEGWLIPASRCRRNNNPGNIRYGSFARRNGATGSDGAFAIFPSAQTGFNALSELLEANYLGMTLKQTILRYAPPSENDSTGYIHDVSAWTGLAPDHVLNAEDLLPPIGVSA